MVPARSTSSTTNDWIAPPESIVFDANDRCNQKNLFSQLKDAGVLYAPLGTLLSNWAYMVMLYPVSKMRVL